MHFSARFMQRDSLTWRKSVEIHGGYIPFSLISTLPYAKPLHTPFDPSLGVPNEEMRSEPLVKVKRKTPSTTGTGHWRLGQKGESEESCLDWVCRTYAERLARVLKVETPEPDFVTSPEYVHKKLLVPFEVGSDWRVVETLTKGIVFHGNTERVVLRELGLWYYEDRPLYQVGVRWSVKKEHARLYQ